MKVVAQGQRLLYNIAKRDAAGDQVQNHSEGKRQDILKIVGKKAGARGGGGARIR